MNAGRSALADFMSEFFAGGDVFAGGTGTGATPSRTDSATASSMAGDYLYSSPPSSTSAAESVLTDTGGRGGVGSEGRAGPDRGDGVWLGSAGRGKGGSKNEEAFVVDSPKVLLAKGSKQLWNSFRKTIRMAAGYQVRVCKM